MADAVTTSKNDLRFIINVVVKIMFKCNFMSWSDKINVEGGKDRHCGFLVPQFWLMIIFWE